MKIDWEKFKQPPNMIKMLAAQKNREFDDDDDDDENDDLDDEVLYNFWICHSDSTINRNVYEAIQHVEGVETLEPVTRYRFRVGIAKLFDEDEVKERIEKTMLSYIDPLNYLIGELKDKSLYWAVAKQDGIYIGIQARDREQLKTLCSKKNVIKSWEKED